MRRIGFQNVFEDALTDCSSGWIPASPAWHALKRTVGNWVLYRLFWFCIGSVNLLNQNLFLQCEISFSSCTCGTCFANLSCHMATFSDVEAFKDCINESLSFKRLIIRWSCLQAHVHGSGIEAFSQHLQSLNL